MSLFIKNVRKYGSAFSKEEKNFLIKNLEEMSRDIEKCKSEVSKKIIANEIKKQEKMLSKYYRITFSNGEVVFEEISDKELERESFEFDYLKELIDNMNKIIEKETTNILKGTK